MKMIFVRRVAIPCAALLACGVLGCAALEQLGDLSGIGSQDQPVRCDITASVVAPDGSAIERLDVAWYPAERLNASTDLFAGSAEGNRVSITQLVVPKDATQVKGELAFNERATPPNPVRYRQVRVPIDLAASACSSDLGTVTLDAR